ncbi:Protein BOLA2 [Geodia barretti]|uniref:Protein BOLA2 n=1 Tax=Geodia barretti TaxID=519541 RepID=A0AA35TVG0_GEOBA|nr:Protein BOLA2 [Geodia barretti]
MNSTGRLCMTGSLAAVVRLTNHWKAPAMGRWITGSSVCQRPTVSEVKVTALLKEKLNPTYLAVEDVSCGCGTSFTIHIDSEQFRGKRALQQHRMVNEALGEEMKEIHSVSIKIGSPND